MAASSLWACVCVCRHNTASCPHVVASYGFASDLCAWFHSKGWAGCDVTGADSPTLCHGALCAWSVFVVMPRDQTTCSVSAFVRSKDLSACPPRACAFLGVRGVAVAVRGERKRTDSSDAQKVHVAGNPLCVQYAFISKGCTPHYHVSCGGQHSPNRTGQAEQRRCFSASEAAYDAPLHEYDTASHRHLQGKQGLGSDGHNVKYIPRT